MGNKKTSKNLSEEINYTSGTSEALLNIDKALANLRKKIRST